MLPAPLPECDVMLANPSNMRQQSTIIAAQILQEPLIRDVLHTLHLQSSQVMMVTPEQLQMLPETLDCAGWLLGVESEQPFNGVALSSASLNELISSGAARRALWQQMCNHDSHLFPHP